MLIEMIIKKLKQHKELEIFARRIRNGSFFNKVKLKVSGLGNKVNHSRAVLNKVVVNINGNHNVVEIKSGAVLNNVNITISGDSNLIEVGELVRFNRGGEIYVEDYDCQCVIGEKSSFENIHIGITEPQSKVNIGSGCMFSYDIDVRTGDSHSIIDTVTNTRINYAKNVNISDRVWVGAHVSILKGAYISEDSVVGSCSNVTGKFMESNVVIAGNPAGVVRKNIRWLRERVYDQI